MNKLRILTEVDNYNTCMNTSLLSVISSAQWFKAHSNCKPEERGLPLPCWGQQKQEHMESLGWESL